MKDSEIHQAINILRQEAPKWKTPAVTIVAGESHNPFYVLVACLLSLRTRDDTTGEAFSRLVKRARTPEELLRIPEEELIEIIKPVTYYPTKAKTLHEISRRLIEEYNGRVPDTLDELLTFKGVGRKTANLVVTIGHNQPGICVDTHVHRICNRWGYVQTRTPESTEFALREKLPLEYWIEFNNLLVAFGQNICQPISPKCSVCPLFEYCERVGVTKSR